MIIYTDIVQCQLYIYIYIYYIYMRKHGITKITHVLFCDSYLYIHFILRKKMETLHKSNSTMAYFNFWYYAYYQNTLLLLTNGYEWTWKEKKLWVALFFPLLLHNDIQQCASLVAQTVRNLPAMWETQFPSLGWEDPWEKGMATHSSILA